MSAPARLTGVPTNTADGFDAFRYPEHEPVFAGTNAYSNDAAGSL